MSVSAVVQSASYTVLIGNREWMRRNALQVQADVDEAMMEHEKRGRTAVLVAVDGECRDNSVFSATQFEAEHRESDCDSSMYANNAVTSSLVKVVPHLPV